MLFGEIQKLIFFDFRFQRRALGGKIRNQFRQAARIHNCSGQNVRAD